MINVLDVVIQKKECLCKVKKRNKRRGHYLKGSGNFFIKVILLLGYLFLVMFLLLVGNMIINYNMTTYHHDDCGWWEYDPCLVEAQSQDINISECYIRLRIYCEEKEKRE